MILCRTTLFISVNTANRQVLDVPGNIYLQNIHIYIDPYVYVIHLSICTYMQREGGEGRERERKRAEGDREREKEDLKSLS